MDTNETFTKIDQLNIMILRQLEKSLANISLEYEKTGVMDKAIDNELIRISWAIHKLNEKKALKLKRSLVSKKCPIHGLERY